MNHRMLKIFRKTLAWYIRKCARITRMKLEYYAAITLRRNTGSFGKMKGTKVNYNEKNDLGNYNKEVNKLDANAFSN